MTDQPAGQTQAAHMSTKSANGNGSQPSSHATEMPSPKLKQSATPKSARVERIKQPSIHKSTGPRTPQGKQRSKFNALKHGLLSKAVLLKDESRADYESLLAGLMQDFQPLGTLETFLVENLAVLLWRMRRFLAAERAEISNTTEFLEVDSLSKQHLEAWDYARAAIASGGMLKNGDNPFVIREAKEILVWIRDSITAGGLREDSRLLKRLYGADADGGIPYGLRLLYEVSATIAKHETKAGDNSDCDQRTKVMVEFIDAEIERLTELEKAMAAANRQRIDYKLSAAIIPGQEVTDRLLRYETHLSREIDRILNRLERLQRRRKGQPLPPRLDDSIN